MLIAWLSYSYDVNVDEIIEEATLESPEIIQKCTTDNVLDEGCVIECVYLGEGACDEYVEIVQNTETADIPETPDDTPPDDTADDTADDTPDLPDVDEEDGDNPDDTSDLETSDNSNTSPTDADDIPEDNDTAPEENDTSSVPSGSLGDPHCKPQTCICVRPIVQTICS